MSECAGLATLMSSAQLHVSLGVEEAYRACLCRPSLHSNREGASKVAYLADCSKEPLLCVE